VILMSKSAVLKYSSSCAALFDSSLVAVFFGPYWKIISSSQIQ